MRTQEQIVAQCEARYAELEKEREARRYTCANCRWSSHDARYCNEPLVKGFDTRVWSYDNRFCVVDNTAITLCGPERALWARRLRWWERAFLWLRSLLPRRPYFFVTPLANSHCTPETGMLPGTVSNQKEET